MTIAPPVCQFKDSNLYLNHFVPLIFVFTAATLLMPEMSVLLATLHQEINCEG